MNSTTINTSAGLIDKHIMRKVSKNRYRGAKIRSLREIAELVKERRSIIIQWSGFTQIVMKPAAWIINQNGAWLNDHIENERMYYCVKEEEL